MHPPASMTVYYLVVCLHPLDDVVSEEVDQPERPVSFGMVPRNTAPTPRLALTAVHVSAQPVSELDSAALNRMCGAAQELHGMGLRQHTGDVEAAEVAVAEESEEDGRGAAEAWNVVVGEMGHNFQEDSIEETGEAGQFAVVDAGEDEGILGLSLGIVWRGGRPGLCAAVASPSKRNRCCWPTHGGLGLGGWVDGGFFFAVLYFKP
jgi:hypothetical protein